MLAPSFWIAVLLSFCSPDLGVVAEVPDDGKLSSAVFAEGQLGIAGDDFLELPSGWSVKVLPGEVGGGVRLGWEKLTRSPVVVDLELPAGVLASLRCAGVVGEGRLVVGGLGADGVGRLLVFGFEANGKAGERERVVFERELVMDGVLAGQFPIGVLALHGIEGHGLLATGPAGNAYDFDWGGGELAPELLGEAGMLGGFGFGGLGQWIGGGTRIDRLGQVTYYFTPRVYFDVMPTDKSLLGHARFGEQPRLEPGPWWSGGGRGDDLQQLARKLDLLELNGVRAHARIEGPPTRLVGILNTDLLRAEDGSYGELVKGVFSGEPDRLLIRWHRADGPWRLDEGAGAEDFDVQSFEVKNMRGGFGAVGPGRVLVSTFDWESGVGRLELYAIEGPVGDGQGGVQFVPPRHLGTVQEAHMEAGELVAAVFENRGKPGWAFLLMRSNSALCELDLRLERTRPELMLSAVVQPALGRDIHSLHSVVYREHGAEYRLGRLTFGCYGNFGIDNFLTLHDLDGNGRVDGRGFDMNRAEAIAGLVSIVDTLGLDELKNILEFAGKPAQ